MRKTILKIMIIFIVLISLFIILSHESNAVAEPTTFTYKHSDNTEVLCFMANGTPITINARTDGKAGAVIVWATGSLTVNENTDVFGGMHNDSTPVTSSITMNAGTIRHIMGGGLHESNTASTKVVINGGKVGQVNGGAADGWISNNQCGCGEGALSKEVAIQICKVGTAEVVINGGQIKDNTYGLVYGGGCRYSNTEKAIVTINGGDLAAAYVVAGGSNGNTTEANLNITGGTLASVQTVNRGTISKATVAITGGTIDTLIIVGDDTGTEAGLIKDSLSFEVSGNAQVEEIFLGTNGAKTIDVTDADSVIKSANIKILAGTVADLSDLSTTEFIHMNEVKIDGNTYLVEEEKTIKDIPLYSNIISKEGYTFKKFVNVANQEEYDVNTKVTSNLELNTVFEKVESNAQESLTEKGEKDETPKTGITNYIGIATFVLLISLLGIVVLNKKRK